MKRLCSLWEAFIGIGIAVAVAIGGVGLQKPIATAIAIPIPTDMCFPLFSILSTVDLPMN
jgi:hypothetical protein